MERAGGTRRKLRKCFQKKKNDLVYLLALVGLWLFRKIPLSLALRIGGALGYAAYYVLPGVGARALGHLSLALSAETSAKERRGIARRSFGNLGKNAAELVNYHRIQGELGRYVSVVGREHLDGALAGNAGVLWIAAHLGNWELMACCLAQLGYPIHVVAREIYDPRLNRLLMRFRSEAGVSVIQRDSPSAAREILRAVKVRGCLAMLIDQDTKVKGVMADFFGIQANTPAGPALLACRQSIPVIAGCIHRLAGGKHEIVIAPPIEIVRTGDTAADTRVNTERFNKILEGFIRQYPDQWVWMHRRWRRRSPYQARPSRKPSGSVTI
ncbi:MAG: lysophospholipid acyltransferase family protein [bacterium]